MANLTNPFAIADAGVLIGVVTSRRRIANTREVHIGGWRHVIARSEIIAGAHVVAEVIARAHVVAEVVAGTHVMTEVIAGTHVMAEVIAGTHVMAEVIARTHVIACADVIARTDVIAGAHQRDIVGARRLDARNRHQHDDSQQRRRDTVRQASSCLRAHGPHQGASSFLQTG
jgi:hypothetical protein